MAEVLVSSSASVHVKQKVNLPAIMLRLGFLSSVNLFERQSVVENAKFSAFI